MVILGKSTTFNSTLCTHDLAIVGYPLVSLSHLTLETSGRNGDNLIEAVAIYFKGIQHCRLVYSTEQEEEVKGSPSTIYVTHEWKEWRNMTALRRLDLHGWCMDTASIVALAYHAPPTLRHLEMCVTHIDSKPRAWVIFSQVPHFSHLPQTSLEYKHSGLHNSRGPTTTRMCSRVVPPQLFETFLHFTHRNFFFRWRWCTRSDWTLSSSTRRVRRCGYIRVLITLKKFLQVVSVTEMWGGGNVCRCVLCVLFFYGEAKKIYYKKKKKAKGCTNKECFRLQEESNGGECANILFTSFPATFASSPKRSGGQKSRGVLASSTQLKV